MRWLVALVLVLLMLVWRMPGSLFDWLVATASRQQVRIAAIRGTVWTGQGTVAIQEPVSKTLRPWFAVQWSFDLVDVLRGRLSWRIAIAGTAESHASVGFFGWQLSDIKVSGAAQHYWQLMSGPLARYAWDGDIVLNVPDLTCSWRQVCDGRIRVEWRAAGSDFLPGEMFGHYTVNADIRQSHAKLDWDSTLDSSFLVQGKGEWSRERNLRLNGTIRGTSTLLRRLPAVAGQWVRPTKAPDTWEVHFP